MLGAQTTVPEPLDFSPGLWFGGVGGQNHSLETAGECWRLLETAGEGWRLLERAGDCWRLLETVGDCWRLLETAGEWCNPTASRDSMPRGMYFEQLP